MTFKNNLLASSAFLREAIAPTVPRDEREFMDPEWVKIAVAALMTGPQATRPRWKTIRRIIYQMKHDIPINGRKIKLWDPVLMKIIIRHPTKVRPVVVI